MYEGYRTPEQLEVPDFERLRVTLTGSTPAIWRELVVPENATFEDLHIALQVAFGWKDAHLHQFEAGFTVGPVDLDGGPVNEPHALDERLTWLYDLPEGQVLAYEYDMGDGWKHAIERLGKVHADGREPRPYVTGGANAGPVEDSGGISNWNDLASRLRKGRATGEEKRWLDEVGYGRDYDVDAFSHRDADARLSRIEFGIADTWLEQSRKRGSIRVVAPFLTDKSGAVHDLDEAPSRGPGR